MGTPKHERPAGRIATALHLLDPRHIRESLALAKQPSLRNSGLAGLQAAIAVAIALPLVALSPWSHLIGFAALGALVALFGRFAPAKDRARVVFYCAIVQVLGVFGMSLATWLGAPYGVLLVLLALSCGVFFFVAVSARFGAPGALIFVFAAGAAMAPASSFSVVFERTAATATVAALAWLVCALTERFRQKASADQPFPDEPVPPLPQRLVASARITIGAAVAVFASHALGAQHPAWAAMGTLAVMQGAHLRISMNRASQRMAGTIVGALLAWLVLNLEPSVWAIIALLVALQFATELIIGSNYGLGQILVTPMALLMSYLAMPDASGSALVLERVMDTVLGAAVGIIIAVLLSSIDDRRKLV